MAPLNVEGRVLLAEMTLPRDAAVTIEGGELAGAEERVEKRAVRDRAGCREVVLLVRRRQRALGVEAALPELLAIGAGERFDDEDGLVGRGSGASGAERPLAQGSGVASLYEPRTFAADPVPICEVTNTRSPLTMGDEMPSAGDRRFPGALSVALHLIGTLRSGATPLAAGPRQCGQSSAWTRETAPIVAAARVRMRWRARMTGL